MLKEHIVGDSSLYSFKEYGGKYFLVSILGYKDSA